MSENTDFFGTYNKAFKSWSDMLGSWSKTMGGISGGTDNGTTGKSFMNFMEKLPLPYERMKNTNEAFIKGMTSYREIYGACVRNLFGIMREGYRIEMQLLSGKEAETDTFFEIFGKGCEDVALTLEETFEDTPFEGIKQINEAVKKSRETLSAERDMAKALFRESIAFNGKMLKLSASATREAMNTFSDVKANGTISVDSYKGMAGACGETLSRSLEILNLPEAVLEKYKNSVDNSVEFAEKNLDALTAWLAINLKSTRALGKSADEITRFARSSFKNGNGNSREAFYERWSECYEKATCNLIEGVHFNGSIPKFINACTDCMKSGSEHCRNLIVLPHVMKNGVAENGVAEEEEEKKAA